MATKVAYFTQI